MIECLSAVGFFHPLKRLSTAMQQEVLSILSNYCESSLTVMSKIMFFKGEVNGHKVITNPSVLSTENEYCKLETVSREYH